MPHTTNIEVSLRTHNQISGTVGDDILFGTRGDDQIEAGDGNDLVYSGKGDDVVSGGEGNDVIATGPGDDIADGGAGNDALFTGRGNDIASGGTGNDYLNLGRGDDIAVYVVSDNDGNHDVYDGSHGADTLRLVLTAAEWARSDIQADIAELRSFLNEGSDGSKGVHGVWGLFGHDTFKFGSIGLTVKNFEFLEIVVEDPPALFTEGDDNVDFNTVVAGTYQEGTQYNGLGGDDEVTLANTTALASAAGYVVGTAFDAGDGDDRVTGGSLDDIIQGGSGDDVLSGGQGNDTIIAGDGEDVLIGGAGDDILDGSGDGLDTADYSTDAANGGGLGIRVNQSANNVQGGLAPDTAIDGFGDTDSIVSVRNIIGTEFDDEIWGGGNANFLDGGAGDDFIFGAGDGDTILGAAGNDILEGGDGDDKLYGGDGNDVLRGQGGEDELYGEAGDDLLGPGNNPGGQDLLDGGDGNDTASFRNAPVGVQASLTDGTATRGTATTTLVDIENLFGSDNNDTLIGDSNNNILNGFDGDDLIEGGQRNDTLIGGIGNDILEGGLGTDTFVFTAGWETDTVVDFDTNGELLDMGSLGIDFTALTINGINGGADTEIFVNGDTANTITLMGVSAATIDASDFIF